MSPLPELAILDLRPHGHALSEQLARVGVVHPEDLFDELVENARYGTANDQSFEHCLDNSFHKVLWDQPRPLSDETIHELKQAMQAWVLALANYARHMGLYNGNSFIPYRLHSFRGTRRDVVVLRYSKLVPAVF